MRLIDADALVEKTDDRYTLHEIGRRERDDIVDAIEYAPTIDAVEVVRCEDCAHYGKDCVLLFPADGYCYDGERREDDTD